MLREWQALVFCSKHLVHGFYRQRELIVFPVLKNVFACLIGDVITFPADKLSKCEFEIFVLTSYRRKQKLLHVHVR